MPVEVEKCQDKVECFNADLKADWERWQSNKRQDFKLLLTGVADKNINHYEKVHRLAQTPLTPVLLRSFKSHMVTDQSPPTLQQTQCGKRDASFPQYY